MISKASLVRLDWHTDPTTEGTMLEIAHAIETRRSNWLYRRYYDRNCGGVYYYRALISRTDMRTLDLTKNRIPDHNGWEPCGGRRAELE